MLDCHWGHTPWDYGVYLDIVFHSRGGNKLLLSGGRCRVGVTHPKGITIKKETGTGHFQSRIDDSFDLLKVVLNIKTTEFTK